MLRISGRGEHPAPGNVTLISKICDVLVYNLWAKRMWVYRHVQLKAEVFNEAEKDVVVRLLSCLGHDWLVFDVNTRVWLIASAGLTCMTNVTLYKVTDLVKSVTTTWSLSPSNSIPWIPESEAFWACTSPHNVNPSYSAAMLDGKKVWSWTIARLPKCQRLKNMCWRNRQRRHVVYSGNHYGQG